MSVNSGDKYRGGYSTSGGISSSEELKIASSTFENYVSGTILLVFLLFVSFMMIAGLTIALMCYSRYLSRRPAQRGFYNPPPMVPRFNRFHYDSHKAQGSSLSISMRARQPLLDSSPNRHVTTISTDL